MSCVDAMTDIDVNREIEKITQSSNVDVSRTEIATGHLYFKVKVLKESEHQHANERDNHRKNKPKAFQLLHQFC